MTTVLFLTYFNYLSFLNSLARITNIILNKVVVVGILFWFLSLKGIFIMSYVNSQGSIKGAKPLGDRYLLCICYKDLNLHSCRSWLSSLCQATSLPSDAGA